MPLIDELDKLNIVATQNSAALTIEFISDDPELTKKYLTPKSFETEKKSLGEWEVDKNNKNDEHKGSEFVRDLSELKNSTLMTTMPIDHDRSHNNWDETLFGGGLIQIAHQAFTRHMPVAYRPDDFHYTILQGLGMLIQRSPKLFSERLGIAVSSDKEDICVNINASEITHVHSSIAQRLIADRKFSPELVELLISPRYSNTKPLDLEIREVALMAIGNEYFNYACLTACFIPKIILKGTQADWEQLAQLPNKLIEVLKLNELSSLRDVPLFYTKLWLERLSDVLQMIVESFKLADKNQVGHTQNSLAADKAALIKQFWLSIYKFNSTSGGKYISGWMVYFNPIVYGTDPYGRKNWIENNYVNNVSLKDLQSRSINECHLEDVSIKTSGLPKGMLNVGVKWTDSQANTVRSVLISAGMYGVKKSSNGVISAAKGIQISIGKSTNLTAESEKSVLNLIASRPIVDANKYKVNSLVDSYLIRLSCVDIVDETLIPVMIKDQLYSLSSVLKIISDDQPIWTLNTGVTFAIDDIKPCDFKVAMRGDLLAEAIELSSSAAAAAPAPATTSRFGM